MNRKRLGRRTITAVLLGIAALAIGSVFGAARDSDAASTVKPSNSAPPTISGTTTEGSTLTATNGTWDGTAPITYTYAWSRCDQTGGSCAGISGATANTRAERRRRGDLRVTVRATQYRRLHRVDLGSDRGRGSEAGTAGTARHGCPAGTGVIPIADLSLRRRPARDRSVTGHRGNRVALGGHDPGARPVAACGGRPVQGALLYATAVPYNQDSIAPKGRRAQTAAQR